MPVHTAIAFLPAAPFYGEMVLLQHLKDVTVGQEHGEWTHLLQWYLLAVWAPHPTFRTSSFFRFLGYQGPEQRAAPVTAPHDGGPTIWQVLFDRVAPYHHEANYLAAGVNDFSCPDMLHLSLAGWATNRGTIWGQVDTATPGLRGVLATNLAWAQTNWPLLTALLRHRMEKRTALFREADRADETLTAAVAELSAKLAALHRSDGTLLINIATSNVKAVLADRSQPFHAAQLTWNVPSLSAAERLGLNRLVEDHRKATERSAHLFHGNGRTKALLYAGSKLSPMALRNPVDWWRSLPPADQARLLGQSTQLFL